MASDTPFDPCASAQVAARVRALARPGPPLVTRVHPSDEMYRFELAAPLRSPDTAAVRYFSTAASIFRTVSDVVSWRFGGFGQVRAFLDFAGGYGRATRFFTRALAAGTMTVAEIDPGAVRFQEETFGVRGLVSGLEPETFSPSGSFDVVLAVSFFSHLPEQRFEAWLARLYSLVADGGVLLFSTHGPALLSAPDALPESGLTFRPESETTRLEGSEYGTSWVSSDFVRDAAARASGQTGRLSAFASGLCGYQDLYVLARPPLPPGPDLRLARDPLGALELATIEDGRVTARGWAAGDDDERPPDVTLLFGERPESISPGKGPAGSRRDWSFAFPVSEVSPDGLVRIEAVSERGIARPLVIETLRPYLPRE